MVYPLLACLLLYFSPFFNIAWNVESETLVGLRTLLQRIEDFSPSEYPLPMLLFQYAFHWLTASQERVRLFRN
jgi:hypothetical protein